MPAPALTALGLMSGTSADGIDGVLVQLSDRPTLLQVQAAFHHHLPFSARQREAIFALFDPATASAERVCRMNFELGEWFATAALETLRAAGETAQGVDVIGSHGQTVLHLPPGGAGAAAGPQAGAPGGGEPGSTLQIGEPAVIAERTGITTVADFRVRDVAAGGHGAPLVSYLDDLLFRDRHRARALLNLGGIANVTILPPLESGAPPLAFDTGPGNMVLDHLARRVSGGTLAYDRDGRLAAGGQVDETFLNEIVARDAYFGTPAPKTTGRERYGAAYAERFWELAKARGLSDAGVMATATALTAQTVAAGLRLAGTGAGQELEVIASGGGTENPSLMGALERRLEGARLSTAAAYGIQTQAKEALAFAVLAAATLRAQPNTVPTCTGARRAVVMGKIVPGDNFPALLRKLAGTPAGG